jgi:hypothetical protein
MGLWMRQLLANLCVTLFLTLFTQGGADPTGGISLRTMSYCKPTAIVRPILDTLTISHGVEGASCEELGSM